MAAKTVIVILLEVIIHLVTLTVENVTANQVLLVKNVTNVPSLIMDFHLMDVIHVIVIRADLRVLNVINMVNVHVTIMLKEDVAIVVRKISSIATKDVLTVLLAITWFKR